MRYLIISFIFLISLDVISSEDSLNSKLKDLPKGLSILDSLQDTTLSYFHFVSQSYLNNKFYLGSFGTIKRVLKFNPILNKKQDFFSNPYYFIYGDKEKLFQVDNNYDITKVAYQSGGNEEIYFALDHSQELFKNNEVSFFLKSINSSGILKNSSVANSIFKLRNRYNLNDKISFEFEFLKDINKSDFNGGIGSKISFETSDLSLVNRSVNYNNARISNYRSNIGLLTKIKSVDSIAVIYHKISYSSNRNTFNDKNVISTNYIKLLGDSIGYGIIWNTQVVSTLYNKLGLILNKKKLKLDMFFENQEIEINYYNLKRHFNITDLNYDLQIEKNINYFSNGYLSIGNYRNLNYSINVGIKKMLNNKLDMLFFMNQSNQSILWNQANFSSQFISYNNSNLEIFKTTSLNFEIVKDNKINFKVKLENQSGFNYFENDTTLVQDKSNSQIISVEADYTVDFDNFHFIPSYLMQSIPAYLKVNLPQHIIKSKLFYESRILNKKMLMQIGTDLFYTSKYFSHRYNPLTRVFINDYSYKIGGYPIIDLYIAGKIKTARFYLKISHINEPLMKSQLYDLYNTPHEPIFFRFGFDWVFLN